jgi:glutamyl/glutaminyl-tRNA synthetase
MFLGWHPSGDREIFSLQEFVKEFSIDRIQKTDLVAADPEKLLWFNAYYIRNTETKPLWHEIKSWAKKFDIQLNGGAMPDEFNMKVLDLVKDRMQTLADFTTLTSYFYVPPAIDVTTLVSFVSDKSRAIEILNNFHSLFENITDTEWTSVVVDKLSHEMIAEKGYKPKEAFMTLRVAVTGETTTPPVFDIIGVLGRTDVLDRVSSAKKALEN